MRTRSIGMRQRRQELRRDVCRLLPHFERLGLTYRAVAADTGAIAVTDRMSFR